MLKRGGERDVDRAAVWFVKWWREVGCTTTGAEGVWVSKDTVNNDVAGQVLRGGWGFDFEWEIAKEEVEELTLQSTESIQASQAMHESAFTSTTRPEQVLIQHAMEKVVDNFLEQIAEEQRLEATVSKTQTKKREKEEQRKKREKRVQAMLERRRSGG